MEEMQEVTKKIYDKSEIVEFLFLNSSSRKKETETFFLEACGIYDITKWDFKRYLKVFWA